ncbi:MAG: NAD(P)/FAD-dependent oxidoreductase [Faecalicatena sp.]|uniref:NAD(P)/FAD-dependent oxidoreductase n=1 Tax=Faecalicatena sp. TaxID=2005360 RepID=UPI0025826DEA|nr:NAD(P)/FAD-dependent oxidoreductase [Faecalicatena sp.]MCI6464902.1 NAD(P)/FAD-dependent oxidoreductase [Faecalicatena sp.]MDY5619896.1 NAD(P)/FAD-dependent oxidoreductase [Lachnospiraceae bacterium]
MYDVIIIGAGVSGCAVARELSRYQVKACVLEKAEDVCCGTSKANSGIVHAGYDAMPGTLMAKLNVRGNHLMGELSEELDFPFSRKGSLVICREKDGLHRLEELKERGEKNGVEGLKILDREQVLAIEPNVSKDVIAALYAPSAGLVCPFSLNIALAENANENGIEFYLDTEVQKIRKTELGFLVQTSRGDYETRYIVNAAGVYADQFHNMVSEKKLNITPRKGEYYLLDKSAGTQVTRTIFALPTNFGKGILVTPTIHGNLLVGPTAADIEDKEGTNTTADGLAAIAEKAGQNVSGLPLKKVITSFAGLRAHEDGHDFVIEEANDAPGFIDCAGIESPGLTSAPAIGEMVAEILRKKLGLTENPHFQGRRKGILDPSKLSMEERNELIQKNPAYGNIICRCEMISEGEILDSIHRPLGARSLDGVKRRTRAGMGRCQSGFCSPRTMEILSRECGIPMEELTKSGGESRLIAGTNKDSF